MKIRKNIQFIYQKKCCEEKHVDLLLIGEEGKRQYALIKDFNTSMCNHTLHRGRKHFCHYCLYAFSIGKTLKRHIKDCFKNNEKRRMMMSRKGKYLKFKYYQRKIKSPFVIYAYFETILVPECNEYQNPEDSYTNKYQKHVACIYGYKLVCVDDKFRQPCKSYLCEDVVYNFISSMIKESKYCSDVLKKHFNKELLMAKEDNEGFENSTKCWICDNSYEVQHIEIVILMLN